jgi:hypothetical protein
MPELDIVQIAAEWKSYSNKQRSRVLQKLTSEQKLNLNLALRDAKRSRHTSRVQN